MFCKFFEYWVYYSAEIPYGSKILSELLYLTRFSRYRDFCVLQFLRKIINGRQFWRDKIFLKIGLTTLQIYHISQKFCQNRSISHGFQDTGTFVFCNFCEKFDTSKWPPVLVRQTLFENWINYPAEIPYGSKISLKSLYLARFSRYRYFCVLQFFLLKSKMTAIKTIPSTCNEET